MTAAFYLRLSMADKEKASPESNSIQGQRQLLQAYLAKRGESLPPIDAVREYIDDGYTGTDFRRPGFQKLLSDAKKGEFQLVLVKDLSRLGRDYIGVGDYLEQIFPLMGIRFIAVNDCYDSAAYLGKAPGIELALENLVNSLYSRDLSVKMKSALRTKWSQGYPTAARAPFGYQRGASQNPAWRIDPESAACVRMIFDQALQGHSTSQIAELLNEKKLPTPGAYRERQGQWGGRRKVPDTEQLWNTAMVWKILTRYEYTGAYVMGRRQKLAAGSTATRKTPEAELIIKENGHPPIVSSQEYRLAQSVLRPRVNSKAKNNCAFLLRGMVRCGTCNLLLSYKVHRG